MSIVRNATSWIISAFPYFLFQTVNQYVNRTPFAVLYNSKVLLVHS